MIDKGVARRYAAALFGAASKANALETVLSDLESLRSLVADDPSLIRFLESPRELDENKEAVVMKLFSERAHELFIRLLLLLLRKNRILHLLDVVDAYRALVEEHQGIVPARVITAVPLDHDLHERMLRELERISGKRIRILPVVDPRIIGGIVVMLAGKVLDRSLRHELDKMRDHLMAARVH